MSNYTFKLLEDVTKNQFVQSPVTLVINIQSQNEYKCTQDVFRVLTKYSPKTSHFDKITRLNNFVTSYVLKTIF